MNQKDVRVKVLELIAERVDDAAYRAGAMMTDGEADATFVDLQVDSLSTLDLCLALENTFGIAVDPAHLVRHPSVNALSRHIADVLPADFRLPGAKE
jgi:acyl carrier protein